jgi:hypothetical protein
VSNLHDGKGRIRSEIKADKTRCHDEMIKNVSDKALEEFRRKPYQVGGLKA